jgi:hypothetical protein
MSCLRCGALCNSIDPHKDNDFVHYQTVEALHTSAVSGCRLCKIIYTELESLNVTVDGSASVTVKIKRDLGFEVTVAEGTPGLAEFAPKRKPLVFYVIFQSFKLPSKFLLQG